MFVCVYVLVRCVLHVCDALNQWISLFINPLNVPKVHLKAHSQRMLLSERCFLASHGHGVCAACHVCSPIYHLQAPPRATATATWHQTRQTAPNVLASFRQLHKATIPSHRKTQSRKPAKATRAPRLILTLKTFSSSYSNKGIHLSGKYHHEQLERGDVQSRKEK